MFWAKSFSSTYIAHRICVDNFFVNWVHISSLSTVESLVMFFLDRLFKLKVHRIWIEITISRSGYIETLVR